MSNIKLVHSGGNSVSLTTPDSNPAANRTFKLPGADGSAGQFLQTNGSGALSFGTPSGGKILSVQQAVKTDVASYSTGSSTISDSYFDISGLSVTLTPSSGTKCFISYTVNVGGENSYDAGIALLRDSTQIYLGDASGSRQRLSSYYVIDAGHKTYGASGQFLDTHGANGSTAVVYKIMFASVYYGYTSYINRPHNADNNAYNMFGSSTITIQEVAA